MTKSKTDKVKPVFESVSQRIPFKLIHMQCCGVLLCHVNHRLPMYCSGCGERSWPHVKGWIINSDMNATLSYKIEAEKQENDIEQ